jgi:ADP-heptose:LPS heptosyltransferase
MPVNFFNNDFNEYPEYVFEQYVYILFKPLFNDCPEISAIIISNILC